MSARVPALLFLLAFCTQALAVGAGDLLGTWEAARSPEGERVYVRLMEKGRAEVVAEYDFQLPGQPVRRGRSTTFAKWLAESRHGSGARMTSPIDAAGRLQRARQIPSPNCDARPDGTPPCLLVVHNISLPPYEFGGDGVIDLFCNRLDPRAHPFYAGLAGVEVSSHFLIRRDGQLIQFVPCGLRAWHAGASSWNGRQRCNDFSIGLELEGSDFVPFRDVQYEQLAQLTRELQAAYPIEDIVGHSDIAPGRKTDPGPFFDWARYRSLISTAF